MRSRGATVLKLVPIDMDGTLVDVESSWAAVHHYFHDHNADGLRDFLAGRIDDHEFIRRDVRIWQRHDPDLTLDLIDRILADVPLMPGAAALVDGLRAAGVRTAILSGGIDRLADRIGRELGIDMVLAN
ncbi:phosphoserine phosphatase, partial [mine drainage metagenome]